MTKIKKIEGFEEYSITDSGKVLSEYKGNFKWKKPSKLGQVNLWTNGERKTMYVHRMVAQAFVPVPSKYADIPIDELDIHHIDHNRKNNITSNLRWLTKTEHQQLHSDSDVTKQRKSEAIKGRPKPEGSGKPPKAVIQFTKDGVFVATYASAYEAERLTKVNRGHICKCCRGKLNSAGGFKWKYAA